MEAQSSLFHPREALPLTEWRDRGRADLAAQLRYVAAASAFYRRKWPDDLRAKVSAATPGTAEQVLEALPITTKDELRLSQEASPPFGLHLACPPEAVIRVHRTSGTTGRPLLIAGTYDDVAATSSHGAQALWCAGLRKSDVVVHCLNFCMWAGGLTDDICLEATGAAVVPFGIGNTETLVDLQRWLPFSALSCTPSYVSVLLDRLAGQDLERWAQNLRLVLVGGEHGGSAGALRMRVANVLGARLANANYGLAEVLSIFGSECEAGNAMHFHGQDALWVELLDPNTQARLPWEAGASGTLVLTHTRHAAQPLVRYQTNDIVEICSVQPCACGRASFRFRLSGRADDMFVVRGINVFPGAVAQALAEVSPELSEFLVRVPAGITLDYFALDVEAPAAGSDALATAITEHIKSRIGCTARVSIVPAGTLPRSENKVGRLVRDAPDRHRVTAKPISPMVD